MLNLEVMEFVQMNTLDFSFLGEKYSDELCCQIADSDIHPITLTEFDHNFAEGLTYVPIVPIRANSIIANARLPYNKAANTKPKSDPYAQEASLLNKFLTEGSKKFDPAIYEYKSLNNGETCQIRVEQQK